MTTRKPSAARPLSFARFAATTSSRPYSSASSALASASVATWRVGTTSSCSGALGPMSLNANTFSSRGVTVEGILPSRILQNRQAGSVMRDGLPHDHLHHQAARIETVAAAGDRAALERRRIGVAPDLATKVERPVAAQLESLIQVRVCRPDVLAARVELEDERAVHLRG